MVGEERRWVIIAGVGVGKRLLTHPSVLTSPGAGPVHLQHHAFDKIMACGEEVSGSEALHRAACFPPLLASLSFRARPAPCTTRPVHAVPLSKPHILPVSNRRRVVAVCVKDKNQKTHL